MIWLVEILAKGLCLFVSLIPRRAQVFMGRALGLFWFYVVPIRRKVAIDNISKSFPDWDQDKVWKTARRNFENYGCGFFEFFLMPVLSKKLVGRLLTIENKNILDQAFEKGNGVFLLTAHMGSWEIMSAASVVFNIKLNVITKKIKTRSLNQVWVKMRVDKGLTLISEEKSTFEILRAIKRNEAVGFILDQFMGPPVGTRVTFFGRETGAPAALALFAGRTKAPVIPVWNIREPDGRIRVILDEPIPFLEQGSNEKNISLMTQVYTSKIEDIVRKYPEQWLWIHRRWKPFRE
jgi:KDO2-lipid IV(A) lauroyltransferase